MVVSTINGVDISFNPVVGLFFTKYGEDFITMPEYNKLVAALHEAMATNVSEEFYYVDSYDGTIHLFKAKRKVHDVYEGYAGKLGRMTISERLLYPMTDENTAVYLKMKQQIDEGFKLVNEAKTFGNKLTK